MGIWISLDRFINRFPCVIMVIHYNNERGNIMDEKEKDLIKQAMYEVLEEYSLLSLDLQIESAVGEIRNTLEDMSHQLDRIATDIYIMQKDMEEIKDSYSLDNVRDFSVVLNKRLAEINAKLSDINRI